MNPQRYPYSGIFTACFAVMMILALVVIETPDAWLPRGIVAVLAALALITTEALWRPRPWAWRATSALGLAHTVAAIALTILLGGVDSLGFAMAYLVFSGVIVVPILASVYQGSVQGPPVRRPVPAPPRPSSPAAPVP